METGMVGQFNWLESTESDFLKILKLCPEVLIGKCLVISCFDSGPLRAAEEEHVKGWQQQGDLVIVPHVNSVSDLPYDNYDEWYIFSNYTNPEITEVFVNAPMTLRSPESLLTDYIAAAGQQVDVVGARHYAQDSAEHQLLFWQEITRIGPESYIGCGDQLIFASQNPELFNAVLKALK